MMYHIIKRLKSQQFPYMWEHWGWTEVGVKRDICKLERKDVFMSIRAKISEIVSCKADAVWSVADIAYSDYKNDFSCAIVIAQRYSYFLTEAEYDEEKYNTLLIETSRNLNKKIGSLKNLLDSYQIKNYVPAAVQNDEINLRVPFSFKEAAVHAGLGWIGKSDVLVTKKFGPRVRLGAILLDYPFLTCAKPIKKSFCGDCQVCIKACPDQALYGIDWNPGLTREDLIDYKLCNLKRSGFFMEYGRKSACGHCILVCPWGLEE